uniref:glutathione transferase n=1 Tax=Romanomermis culicivorax TaxID=13658 RepID=A0A915HSS0_ROMCU
MTDIDNKSLAEPIRLLLVDNDIPFEDDQFEREKWAALKPSTTKTSLLAGKTFKAPLGQVPILYHNNVPLAQSGAILRHLARKHGLYGSDLNEAAYIDMFYESVIDARRKYQEFIYRDSETRENFINNIKVELKKIEDLCTKHKCFPPLKPGGYICGSKMTYADYVFFEFLDALVTLDDAILDNLTQVKEYYKSVAARPHLAKYLASDKRKVMKINGNGKQ